MTQGHKDRLTGDRRLVPAPGDAARRTCTWARSRSSRGRRRRARSSPSTSSRGCIWSRATARSCRSRGSRWAGRSGSTTRSFNLDYHVRHTGAALARHAGAAARAGRADLLPAPRPLQAAVGDLARPGPRGQPLRADLEDPPRAGGRRVGRGHRDGAVRPVAAPAAGRRRSTLGAFARALAGGAGGGGSEGAHPHARLAGRAGREGRRAARGRRWDAPWRPPREWARWPGRASTPRRTCRSTCRSARTAGCSGCRASWPTSRRSRTASAGR